MRYEKYSRLTSYSWSSESSESYTVALADGGTLAVSYSPPSYMPSAPQCYRMTTAQVKGNVIKANLPVYIFPASAVGVTTEGNSYAKLTSSTSGAASGTKYTRTRKTNYSKGSYIETLEAEDGIYPDNGHQGGYWYVKIGTANDEPTLSLNTPQDGRTIYENDILSLAGSADDVNVGNVVSIKYKIDGGTTRAISANISQGTAISFAKNLTYKAGMLYDGATPVTEQLAEGSQHVVTVWAEDDQGGKSPEISRSFYVVANRPAQLTFDAFVEQSELIDTDKITISGNINDPDDNPVTLQYKIGTGQYTTVYSGQSGAFTFDIELSQLTVGANTVTLQAIDSHAAITQQVLKITKTANEVPVNESVAYFKVTPPNGTTDGVVIWIERDIGDLVVSAEISMTTDNVEQFVPMTLERTSHISDAIAEDQFTYEHTGPATNVVVRLTLNRTNAASTHAVRLFSGVLS